MKRMVTEDVKTAAPLEVVGDTPPDVQVFDRSLSAPSFQKATRKWLSNCKGGFIGVKFCVIFGAVKRSPVRVYLDYY